MAFTNILITGATGGIGAETARQLIAANPDTKVFLTGRDAQRLETLADELGDHVAGQHACDLTTPNAAAKVVEQAVDAFDGALDAVIHCAGVGLIKSAADTTDGEFSRIINTNTRTTFLIAQASLEAMAANKKGRFFTLPGTLGKYAMRNASAYVASKWAVTGMLKCMALEYQRKNVNIGLFFFGGVATPFWDDLDMKIAPDKVISAETAAQVLVQSMNAPDHLVPSELVLQPESHQLGL